MAHPYYRNGMSTQQKLYWLAGAVVVLVAALFFLYTHPTPQGKVLTKREQKINRAAQQQARQRVKADTTAAARADTASHRLYAQGQAAAAQATTYRTQTHTHATLLTPRDTAAAALRRFLSEYPNLRAQSPGRAH